MGQYVIAFEPENKLIELVNIQKNLIKEKIGDQFYLSHPPHITLYVISTDNLIELQARIDSIKDNFKKFNISIDNLEVFYNDQQTNGNTLYYSFSNISKDFLRKLQLDIINKVKELNSSLGNFEYPYEGKNWIPHITIASIEEEKFDNIFTNINPNPIQGDFSMDKLVIYEYDHPKTPILIKSFNLEK